MGELTRRYLLVVVSQFPNEFGEPLSTESFSKKF